MRRVVLVTLAEAPDFLTVEETARLLRLGRTYCAWIRSAYTSTALTAGRDRRRRHAPSPCRRGAGVERLSGTAASFVRLCGPSAASGRLCDQPAARRRTPT